MTADYMTIAMIKIARKRNGEFRKEIPTGKWNKREIYEVSIDWDKRVAKVRYTYATHSAHYPPYAAVWRTIQYVCIDTFDIMDEKKTHFTTNSQKYSEL